MDQISGSMQSLRINDDDLAELQNILNYKFNNKCLLEEALTHSSMDCTKSYERLEFLGDSVLGYLITKHLYSTYPERDPGNLSELRKKNVENENFARVSVKHKLHQFLPDRMKQQPELQRLIEKFVKATEDDSESKSLQVEDCKPPKVLADIVESIAGAVLVDSGHSVDKVWEVFMPLLELEPLVPSETLEQDPVAELQELCEEHGKDIEYRYRQKGNKVRVKVLINGKGIANGEHQQKELADREAAEHALDELKEMLKEEERVETARRLEYLCTRDLNNFCRKNHWPSPFYRLVQDEGPSCTQKFVYAVSACTENESTKEYFGNPMPRKKEAKRSAAKAILDSFNVTNFS